MAQLLGTNLVSKVKHLCVSVFCFGRKRVKNPAASPWALYRTVQYGAQGLKAAGFFQGKSPWGLPTPDPRLPFIPTASSSRLRAVGRFLAFFT
jgi:hypothetical protein